MPITPGGGYLCKTAAGNHKGYLFSHLENLSKGYKIPPKIEFQSLKESGIVSIACLRALVGERNHVFRTVRFLIYYLFIYYILFIIFLFFIFTCNDNRPCVDRAVKQMQAIHPISQRVYFIRWGLCKGMKFILVSQRVPKITKVSLSKGRTLKFWFGHTRHLANLVPPPWAYNCLNLYSIRLIIDASQV